jgi:hypothetical protein
VPTSEAQEARQTNRGRIAFNASDGAEISGAPAKNHAAGAVLNTLVVSEP